MKTLLKIKKKKKKKLLCVKSDCEGAAGSGRSKGVLEVLSEVC